MFTLSPSQRRHDAQVIVDLTTYCSEALHKLAVHGAAFSIVGGHTVHVAAATNESYARMERTQHFHGKGPLIDSCASHEPLAVRELSAHTDEWPELSALAGRLGIQSALVVPSGTNVDVELVFSAYSRTARTWTKGDINAAKQIARRAVIALHSSDQTDDLVLGDAQRRGPAAEGVDPAAIARACTLIARRQSTTEQAAATLLARLASHTGLTKAEVAAGIIRTYDGQGPTPHNL